MSRESVELGELIFPAKVIRCGRDEYPVFSMTMHDGIVEQKTRFKKALASKDQSNYKVVKPGQLVVGFPIDEGVLYIQQLGKKGIMSPAYNIWDVDQEKVYPGFLELALHSPQSMSWYKAKLRGTTARRRNIPAKDLIKLRICLPEKSVQSRIVDTFQQIKEELSFFASLNEKLDDLVKSRFVEMFGYIGEGTFIYPPKRIEDLCLEIIGGGTPSMKHPEYYGGSIPFIKSGDVKSQVVTNGNLSITKEGLKRSSAKLAPMHSILVVTRSGILKHTLPIAIAGCSVAINQDLKALVLNESVIPEYIQWSLLVSEQLILSKVRATTADNIETSLLKNFMVPVPPLQLQHEFADFAAQVDKLKFDFDFLVSFSIPSICLFCLKLDP